MAQEQYVLQFKCLRFKGSWSDPTPVQAPQGIIYTAIENCTLMVVVHQEPDKFLTLSFKVPGKGMVGVSIPENLVFLPKVDQPIVEIQTDIKLIFT
jgi:hypothetical protein